MTFQPMTSRRSLLRTGFAVTAGTLSGCIGGGPPHLAIANYDIQDHTLAVAIRKNSDEERVFRKTYELRSKQERSEDEIFNDPGEYTTNVSMDFGDKQSFSWTVDSLPVAGGFRIVIQEGGSLIAYSVGSP